jgi:hypothetical protein
MGHFCSARGDNAQRREGSSAALWCAMVQWRGAVPNRRGCAMPRLSSLFSFLTVPSQQATQVQVQAKRVYCVRQQASHPPDDGDDGTSALDSKAF